MTAIDVERARADTPGVANVIHFNNAGAALMPAPVLRALKDHLDLEAAIGGYEALEARLAAADNAYLACASLLNAGREEIAIVENATRAWDMAFYALARDLRPGDRILTARAEYASNYIAFLQVARRTGAVVEAVDNDETGQLSIADLERRIDGRAKLIAITHVPTNGGLVNPAEAVGRVARAANIPYLLDACQSAGQLAIDVERIGCDVLSGTGRKYLRGPRGTGFLYVRAPMIERLEPPFLDLHAATWTGKDSYAVRPDARRFENWETYVAGKIGLGVAVDYALALGIGAIEARVRDLGEMLRRRLGAIPGVAVHDLGRAKCGIVSFAAAGRDAETVREQLRRRSINVTVSGVSSTRLDMEDRGLASVVRASVHYYNTDAEIEAFANALDDVPGGRSRP